MLNYVSNYKNSPTTSKILVDGLKFQAKALNYYNELSDAGFFKKLNLITKFVLAAMLL